MSQSRLTSRQIKLFLDHHHVRYDSLNSCNNYLFKVYSSFLVKGNSLAKNLCSITHETMSKNRHQTQGMFTRSMCKSNINNLAYVKKHLSFDESQHKIIKTKPMKSLFNKNSSRKYKKYKKRILHSNIKETYQQFRSDLLKSDLKDNSKNSYESKINDYNLITIDKIILSKNEENITDFNFSAKISSNLNENTSGSSDNYNLIISKNNINFESIKNNHVDNNDNMISKFITTDIIEDSKIMIDQEIDLKDQNLFFTPKIQNSVIKKHKLNIPKTDRKLINSSVNYRKDLETNGVNINSLNSQYLSLLNDIERVSEIKQDELNVYAQNELNAPKTESNLLCDIKTKVDSPKTECFSVYEKEFNNEEMEIFVDEAENMYSTLKDELVNSPTPGQLQKKEAEIFNLNNENSKNNPDKNQINNEEYKGLNNFTNKQILNEETSKDISKNDNKFKRKDFYEDPPLKEAKTIEQLTEKLLLTKELNTQTYINDPQNSINVEKNAIQIDFEWKNESELQKKNI